MYDGSVGMPLTSLKSPPHVSSASLLATASTKGTKPLPAVQEEEEVIEEVEEIHEEIQEDVQEEEGNEDELFAEGDEYGEDGDGEEGDW